jgi:hypothetical protein
MPTTVWAQSESDGGTTIAAVAGAALGGYSGAMLGLTGSLIPCGQTYGGPTCAGLATLAGAAAGFGAGIPLGRLDDERIAERFRGGLWGAGIGAVAGYALKGVVRQYGWLDVASGAALGLAVGASARGAGIGFLAGAATGGVLLAIVPDVRVVDAVGVSLTGMAIGGAMGWVVDAARAGDAAGTPVMVSFSIPR